MKTQGLARGTAGHLSPARLLPASHTRARSALRSCPRRNCGRGRRSCRAAPALHRATRSSSRPLVAPDDVRGRQPSPCPLGSCISPGRHRQHRAGATVIRTLAARRPQCPWSVRPSAHRSPPGEDTSGPAESAWHLESAPVVMAATGPSGQCWLLLEVLAEGSSIALQLSQTTEHRPQNTEHRT